MTTQHTGESLKTTRRTLVKGAAWSVPVVAMGSTAPAFAASPTFNITGVTIGCKFSNSKAYHLEITIENTGNQPNTIEDVVVTGLGSNGNVLVWPAVADQCMCPGDTWVLVINSVPDAASSFGASIQWAGATPPGPGRSRQHPRLQQRQAPV